MTKTLTQDDFKDAPDCVKSAAVAENGYTIIEFIDDSGAIIKRQSCKSYEIVR